MARLTLRALLLLWTAAGSLPQTAHGSPTPADARTEPRLAAPTLSLAVRPHRRRGHVNGGFDGAAERRRIFLKHGMPLPPELLPRRPTTPQPPLLVRRAPAADEQAGGADPAGVGAVSSSAGGTQSASAVAISDGNDVEYLVEMSVGGTLMKLDLDTGSSDFWVLSDQLTEPAGAPSHALYPVPTATGATRSRLGAHVTGAQMGGASFTIRYGDGTTAAGLVFTDAVTVLGQGANVTATAQAVGAATSVADRFFRQGNDGIVGMGFASQNTVMPVKQKTFFDNIKGGLRMPVFTAWLKHGAGGAYDFGYIDPLKYRGTLQYIPVNTTRGYWEVHSSAYKVGNAPRVPLATQAVVDTGSTLLMLPNQTVRDFYAAVPSAQLIDDEGGWVHDCGAALPDLTLEASSSPAGGGGGAESAGTATLVLRGSLLTRGRSSRAGSPWCFGGVQATGAAGMTIWGDVLLKALFVVFDGSEAPAGPRVGFALQATPPAG